MEKKDLNSLLGDAIVSQRLERLIEATSVKPETIQKAELDLRATRAKIDQIKNEKEALDAKQRGRFYKSKVKEIDLNNKYKKAGPVNESKRQEAELNNKMIKAVQEAKEKKEEVDQMKDPLAIVKEEEMTPIADDTLIPLSKDGVTVIKFGTEHGGEKQQLEPKITAPDPEKDPEFDGPAKPDEANVTVTKIELSKEVDPMEKNNVKEIFAESISDMFRILREEEPQQVGEVPAVQSQEAKPVQQQAQSELPKEESVEVSKEAQPEILVTDTSIRIEIPVESDEKPAESIGQEASEAMVESLRVIYQVLSGKQLNESEDGTVEVPADAKAEVKFEGDKLIVEIPTDRPIEEIGKDDAEAIKEAALVLASVLKEQKLGDVAAKPVHDEKKAAENKPDVKEKEVHAGEQKAEEVKAPIIESKHEGKKEEHKEEKHEKSEKHSIKEEEESKSDLSTSAVPTVEETDTVPQTEPKKEDKPEEKVEVEEKRAEETVEVSKDAEPEVMVSDSSIRIEIPVEIAAGAEMPDLSKESMEKISESMSAIMSIFAAASLNEEETVEVESDVEAEVKVEGDKLVIEIPVDSPKQEISDEEMGSVMESVASIANTLHEVDWKSFWKTANWNPFNWAKRYNKRISYGIPQAEESVSAKSKEIDTRKMIEKINFGAKLAPQYSSMNKAGSSRDKVKGFFSNIPFFDKESKNLQTERINKHLADIDADANASLASYAGDKKFGKLGSALTYDPTTRTFKVDKSKIVLKKGEKLPADFDVKAEAFAKKAQTGLETKFGNPTTYMFADPSSKRRLATELYGKDYEAAKKNFETARDTGVPADEYKKNIGAFDRELETARSGVAAREIAASLKDSVMYGFNPKFAESLVEGYEMDPADKAQFVADIMLEYISSNLRRDVSSSGFALNEAGLTRFFESKSIKLNEEEKKELLDLIDSEKISKDLSDKNELQASEDLEKNEVDNSKREEGNEKAEEVKAPIIESSEPSKPEHSVDQQYNVDAAIKVDMNSAKADKEHEIKKDIADHKAEPKDVTAKDNVKPGEEAEYRSLKEAFLLEDGYFEKESVSKVTPEQKQDKLVNQISLLVARESADPLYEELLHATAVARQLQTELQEKYKASAKKKAKQLIDSKSKKPENPQASSLKLVEFLDAVGSGRSSVNEGIIDWVKGKLVMALINILPEPQLDNMIMKAHTKALSLVKSSEERKAVEEEFSRYLKDRRDKVEFLKALIKRAPEKDKEDADNKLKNISSRVSKDVEAGSKQGVAVNASYEVIASQPINEVLDPASALLAGGALSMVLNILVGLVLAGTVAVVTEIVMRIRASIADPYRDFSERHPSDSLR